MTKKREATPQPTESSAGEADPATLGAYLSAIRGVRRLTLRAVEEATNGEVSNAYLSQIENNKITRPSPNVLHALARVLVVPYETLMQKAGYLAPTAVETGALRSASAPKKAKQSVFEAETLTSEEEEALLEYLAFLRSRKGGPAKS